uniref:UBX domain-containing protein 8 isoform X2 n=1 Tax=Callorhinus ursinus TaxID=34884 RepID=A0A3Q7RN97_CALUR|nr:UBX domain-containing protein 8 isoform X2 [Callorhinus ursinus]
MASRGIVGLFLLSALPLLCLELRRGIPDLVYLKEEEENNEKRQKLVRKKQQEAQSEKASRYIENVLKPHQEMKLRKLEERFYQMTGETWKLSNGHKLGVLGLPEEPPETAEEIVTVALRCPSGSVLRRRFLKSCSSRVLLDWMMKIGYHTSRYSLSTSFPRRPLEVEGGWSLQDTGITMDTVLIVEEKEQSN